MKVKVIHLQFWTVFILLEHFYLPAKAAHRGMLKPKLSAKHIVKPVTIQTEYLDNLSLDNFDPLNTVTWKMRYFCTWEFYNGTQNAPFFVYLSGEQEVTPYAVQSGSYVELCEEVGCVLCAPELRFFGESFPINDTKVESLKYLTTLQAIADFAIFIKEFKKEHGFTKENKVVVIGGSYSGMQAYLLRAKYPYLVDIAWASSTLAEDVFDYPGYFENIGHVIKNVSPTCYDEVNKAFHELEKMIWTCHCDLTSKNCDLAERNYRPPTHAPSCALKVNKFMNDTFDLCDPFDVTNEGDIRNFFQYIAQDFAAIVQYNSNYVVWGLPNYNIESLCNIFESFTSNQTSIQKLSDFVTRVNYIWGFGCIDYTEKRFCEQMGETGSNANITAGIFIQPKQWMWLVCSQISYLQTIDSTNQPFGRSFPASFLVQQCQCVFGQSFTQNYIEAQVENQNLFRGGRYGTKSSTRVIFYNGSYDPWHSKGVLYQNETSCANRVFFIEGTTHCFDLYPSSPSDPPQITTARKEIHGQIKKWLNTEQEQPCC